MSQHLDIKITGKSVFRFTLPSIVMMVVMALYTVVDGIFVSQLIDTNAFSAVNLVYPLLSVIVALGTMFGSGVTAIVARKLGEGKNKEANEILTFVILFTVGLGIVISVMCLFLLKYILVALGANEEVFSYCYQYAYPLVFFLPASLLQLQFQDLFVANGKPHIGLILTVSGGLANIALDYVFIAVCKMGIGGAAVATGIGYAIPSVFGLLYFSLNRRSALRFVKFRPNWRALLHTVTNGSSEMVSYLSASITTFLFNLIMMRALGPTGVAAVAVLLYFDFVFVAVSLGYSIGVAPLISYNHGKNEPQKLRKIYRMSAIFTVCAGFFITAATLIFASPLASVFADKGSEVHTLAVTGLRIYAFGYLFKGFNIFSSALFTAFNNGKVSAVLSFLRTLVFLAGMLLALSALFGVQGVWYASPVAEVLALLLSVFFTMRHRRYFAGAAKDVTTPKETQA